MPNDAKLGMVTGVALVIAVALFFVHKDAPPAAVRAASTLPEGRPGQQGSGQPDSPAQPPAEEEKTDDCEDGHTFEVRCHQLHVGQ